MFVWRVQVKKRRKNSKWQGKKIVLARAIVGRVSISMCVCFSVCMRMYYVPTYNITRSRTIHEHAKTVVKRFVCERARAVFFFSKQFYLRFMSKLRVNSFAFFLQSFPFFLINIIFLLYLLEYVECNGEGDKRVLYVMENWPTALLCLRYNIMLNHNYWRIAKYKKGTWHVQYFTKLTCIYIL